MSRFRGLNTAAAAVAVAGIATAALITAAPAPAGNLIGNPEGLRPWYLAVNRIADWHRMRPCPTEDSTACTWNAGQRGNQQGVSFIAVYGHRYYPLPTTHGLVLHDENGHRVPATCDDCWPFPHKVMFERTGRRSGFLTDPRGQYAWNVWIPR